MIYIFAFHSKPENKKYKEPKEEIKSLRSLHIFKLSALCVEIDLTNQGSR